MVKTIKSIIIGSRPFFSCYDDYVEKDIDELNLMTPHSFFGTKVFQGRKDNKDIFFMENLDKGVMLKEVFNQNLPMAAGKFLVPEFAEHIGLTIDELKTLKPLFEKMDDKHKYECIIYEAYIKNNDFKLTDEQRLEAYNEYKKARGNIYEKKG